MCGTKRDFAALPVKFNFCRQKSATKFLCSKTSSGKVVATSFLYLKVHNRRMAGDVRIYLKFALQVTHPFRQRQFRQISLNTAAALRASEKVQLCLIGSRHRQCAFHRAIDDPSALPLSPPNDGTKREFLPFVLPFIPSVQAIVDN